MTLIDYIVGIVLIVFAIAIILIVLLQQGREANLGAISGGADSFLEKGKARTLDALLEKYTKLVAVLFFVLVFAGMLITHFVSAGTK